MKTRIIALLVLALALTACSGKKAPADDGKTTDTQTRSVESTIGTSAEAVPTPASHTDAERADAVFGDHSLLMQTSGTPEGIQSLNDANLKYLFERAKDGVYITPELAALADECGGRSVAVQIMLFDAASDEPKLADAAVYDEMLSGYGRDHAEFGAAGRVLYLFPDEVESLKCPDGYRAVCGTVSLRDGAPRRGSAEFGAAVDALGEGDALVYVYPKNDAASDSSSDKTDDERFEKYYALTAATDDEMESLRDAASACGVSDNALIVPSLARLQARMSASQIAEIPDGLPVVLIEE
mgnify:FL=1